MGKQSFANGQAEIGGGSCKNSATRAGAAATFGFIPEAAGLVGQGIARARIGGLASVAPGGKFENGAVTAAFGYIFSQLSRAQELMNERIMSGRACAPSHISRCSGIKAGTPEDLANAARTAKEIGKIADTSSTTLAYAATWTPFPINAQLAAGSLALRGVSYALNPPPSTSASYDTLSNLAPYVGEALPKIYRPSFALTFSFYLEVVKPSVMNRIEAEQNCAIPRRC